MDGPSYPNCQKNSSVNICQSAVKLDLQNPLNQTTVPNDVQFPMDYEPPLP